MKLFLTSAGFTNETIIDAFRGMLGKPTGESNIVVIPTGQNPEAADKGWVIKEDMVGPYSLGWRNFEIVDLAAMHSLPRELWWPKLERADVLLIGGGNSFYLSYWMQKCGMLDVLPKWLESKVYVGISAGSMVAGESLRADSRVLERAGELHDDEYDVLGPEGQSSGKTLQLVDFVYRPHLNSPNFPKVREDLLSNIAAKLSVPMYACDDDTALKVIDGTVEVISEGKWKLSGK